MSYSLECQLVQITKEIPIHYLKLISNLFIFIIFLFVVNLLYLIVLIFHKNLRNKKKAIFYTSFIYLFIYLQPGLISQMIMLVSCRTVSDKDYIKANMNYQCWTQEHKTYTYSLIVPSMILFFVIIPLILFLCLYFNKKKLNSLIVSLKFGFLYLGIIENKFFLFFS